MAVTFGFPNNTGGLSAKQTLRLGTKEFFEWRGIAKVVPGASYASLDIKIPSNEKGFDDVSSLVIPANTEIVRVAFKCSGNLTIGAATGKLKLATAVNASAADLYVESAAASGGTLTAATVTNDNPLDATTTVGGTDVTYKIYATDGGAAGAAVASTVAASTETLIYVVISGYYPAPFPVDREFGELRDNSIYTDVTNNPVS